MQRSTTSKVHNSPIKESKYTEMAEKPKNSEVYFLK
jgi:hypothetical protein